MFYKKHISLVTVVDYQLDSSQVILTLAFHIEVYVPQVFAYVQVPFFLWR